MQQKYQRLWMTERSKLSKNTVTSHIPVTIEKHLENAATDVQTCYLSHVSYHSFLDVNYYARPTPAHELWMHTMEFCGLEIISLSHSGELSGALSLSINSFSFV